MGGSGGAQSPLDAGLPLLAKFRFQAELGIWGTRPDSGSAGGGLAGRLRAPGSDIPLYWDLGGRQCGAGGLGSVKVGAVAGVGGGRGAAPCC